MAERLERYNRGSCDSLLANDKNFLKAHTHRSNVNIICDSW
jgi:hypothetical protein